MLQEWIGKWCFEGFERVGREEFEGEDSAYSGKRV
jgi:hypothetical protein